MRRHPLSSSELARALDCHLIQPDGTRWEVVEVTLMHGRAWVRACPAGEDPPSVDANGDGAARRRDLVDIALPPSARLEWLFPGGWRVRAEGREAGGLRWSVEGPGGVAELDGGGDFFRDSFLGASPERRRNAPPGRSPARERRPERRPGQRGRRNTP